MGCHSKPSRPRLSRRLPAAAPALAGAGLAAAVWLAPQALASTSASHAAGRPATVGAANIVSTPYPEIARLFTALRQVTAPSQGSTTYKVRPDDTLTKIAGRVYHDPNAWPVLYWANRHQVKWANQITAGQVLKVPAKPAKIPAAPGQLGPAAPTETAIQPEVAVVTDPGGSFAACVIARESGGNSQVMNSSGHYGLYQFSASTWAEYGGNPADFGNASVSEQNQVFDNALAAGGQSNWSAYDGC
ncbi:MAG: LysM peptidoglycan-binding domain-containing protein [Streptosporangiaceae bacterium]